MPISITTNPDDAEQLRARRLALHITQRQLATAAGCSLTSLSNIEAGCVPTQSEVLERISAALRAAEQRPR